MDITTQQFLMGSAGAGGQNYWLTQISRTSPEGGFDQKVFCNCFDFTSDEGIVFATASTNPFTISKMADDGTLLWTDGRYRTSDYVYAPRAPLSRVLVKSNGDILAYGKSYYSNDSQYAASVLTYSNNGAYQSEIILKVNTGSMEPHAIRELSNGNLFYLPVPGYYHITNSTATSMVVSKDGVAPLNSGVVQRLNADSVSVNPIATSGDITYAYGACPTGTTPNRYLTVIGFNSSLGVVGTYSYYRNDFGSAIYPMSLAKTSGGFVFNWASDDQRQRAKIAYATPSGVQWSKYVTITNYDVSDSPPQVCTDAQDNIYFIFYKTNPYNTVVIFKYDISGNVVWKRELYLPRPGYGYFTMSTPKVYNNALYIYANHVIAKLDLDGGGIGTYGSFTYSASAMSDGDQSTGWSFNNSSNNGYTISNPISTRDPNYPYLAVTTTLTQQEM